MDKCFKPERLEVDPNSRNASVEYKHWLKTFRNYLTAVQQTNENVNQLNVLTNFVSATVYSYIGDCPNFDEALETLRKIYIKPQNEIFARHVLSTREQHPSESIEDFLQNLLLLAKDCNFKAVTAEKNRNDFVRDSFIRGLKSHQIRQRLLENETLDIDAAFNLARSLDSAMKNATFFQPQPEVATASQPTPSDSEYRGLSFEPKKEKDTGYISTASQKRNITRKCFFCGNVFHPRYKCPAKSAECYLCGKVGHFAKQCQSTKSTKMSASIATPHLAVIEPIAAGAPTSLELATVDLKIDGVLAKTLIDSGASDSFMNRKFASENNFSYEPRKGNVNLASKICSAEIVGSISSEVIFRGQPYKNVEFSVVNDLCADVILGQDFMRLHESVVFKTGGARESLIIDKNESYCCVAPANVTPPRIFQHMNPNCKPIASKSRRYSRADHEFITLEIKKLLEEGIIEPSESPWRAQVVVTKDDRHKKRMVVDYSQTVNRYSHLDAYPLPRIDDQINYIAQHSVFSTVDLKSAYHQIPLLREDRPFTAFEANGKLYQFCRLPFGVTNGVSFFQRTIDSVIESYNLKGCLAYLDNITIFGKNQIEHDINLNAFFDVAKKLNLTFNQQKSIISVKEIKMLGYLVSKSSIRPDPERFKPLMDLPLPQTKRELKRIVGMFAYYSKWIPNFSHKIKPLSDSQVFPLSDNAVNCFLHLKQDLLKARLNSIDDDAPFSVECDASDFAIAAILSQNNRPVAFMSRTLSRSEQHYPAVEKEATAIIEAVRKWSHYLLGRTFTLVTDQKSLSFVFDNRKRSKIKNSKIMLWRIELGSFSYDIVYKRGQQNVAPDAFSRVCASLSSSADLDGIHKKLGHPGVSRLIHFIRMKNLPFSVEDVKRVCSQCRTCAEIKPQFYKPDSTPLIKATRPWERISIDFKGPISSKCCNPFLLVVIDEFSRFPFAFPCKNVSSQSVISCLTTLFSIFGLPGYVHSDRGAAFMSRDLKSFLHSRGVATSRTTPYHPTGNAQCERYNQRIWKTVQLFLRNNRLPEEQWEMVLTDALHSVRSLLCTATNATPHEQFLSFPRKSMLGKSLPSWLTSPGTVLLRRFVRQ